MGQKIEYSLFPSKDLFFNNISDCDLKLFEEKYFECRYQFLELMVDSLSIIIRNETKHISKKNRISRQLLRIGKAYVEFEPSEKINLWLKVIHIQLSEVASKKSILAAHLLFEFLTALMLLVDKSKERGCSLSDGINLLASEMKELKNELEKFLINIHLNDEGDMNFLCKQKFLLVENLILFIKEPDAFND